MYIYVHIHKVTMNEKGVSGGYKEIYLSASREERDEGNDGVELSSKT